MLDQVITGERTFHALPQCDLSKTNKSEISAYFENSYNLNDSLFTSLKNESVMYKCPDRLRLPLIFYYGHTACVYINKLILAELIQPEDRVNLQFETIFETGVDEMSWDDTENNRMGGKFQWPALDDVIEYRRKVRHLILDVIEKTQLELPITMDSPWWALFMGMEHERIHLETSSVLIRQLPVAMVTKPDGFVYGPIKGLEPITDNPMLPVSTQDITLGKPINFPSYGWDNEYGQRDCKVTAFNASKFMITNREFREFVEADGYNKSEFWTDEGWKWKEFCQATHPVFWVCDKGCKSRCGDNIGSYSHCHQGDDDVTNHVQNGGVSNGCNNAGGDTYNLENYEEGGQTYRLRCMFDVLSMPCDWPVEVTYHEAKAYCKWKGPGYRLPSEAEHNAIRDEGCINREGRSFDVTKEIPSKSTSLLRYGSSTPVNLHPANHVGFHDVLGNAWEWTDDHFNGFPGFTTSYLYDDYSFTSFDGQHNIMLGGSWCSSGAGASCFARYAFRRHVSQHCGFRLVKSCDPGTQTETIRVIKTLTDKGESDGTASCWLDGLLVTPEAANHSHYAHDTEMVVQKHLMLEHGDESVTLPCLQTIKTWLDKFGIDTSGGMAQIRFLQLGCGAGSLSFRLSAMCSELLAVDTSGRLVDVCLKLQAGKDVLYAVDDRVNIIPAPMIENHNIIFRQFSWLPNEVGFFHLVIATFFDRTENVLAWTCRLREIVTSGGLLMVTSAGKWTGQNLAPLLNKHFKMVAASDISGSENIRITCWRRESRS